MLHVLERRTETRQMLPAEVNVLSTFVEAEAAGWVGQHLERHWPLEGLVFRVGDCEHVMRTHVRDHELVAWDKADAVDAR